MGKTNNQSSNNDWIDVGELSPEEISVLLGNGYEVEVDNQVYKPIAKPVIYPPTNNPKMSPGFEQSNAMTNDFDTRDYRSTLGIQQMLNRDFNAGLKEDGMWGPKTQYAYDKYMTAKQQAAASYENMYMQPTINSIRPTPPENPFIPNNVGPPTLFGNYIAAVENNTVHGTERDYKFQANGIHSATGPYQITYINEADLKKRYDIKKFEDIRNCPSCQEDYMKYLEKKLYDPGLNKIRAMGLGKDRNDLELKFCQHNRGYSGCIACLKAGTCDDPTYDKNGRRTNMGLKEYYNTALSRYHDSLKAAGLPTPPYQLKYNEGGLVRGGTKKVQEYQRWMNKTFGAGLKEDGAWGPKTQAAYEKFVVNNSQTSKSIDIIPKLGNDADNTYTIVPVAQTVAPSKMTMDTLPKDIPLINEVPIAYNNAEQVGYSLPEQVPTTGYPFPQFVVPSAVPVETVYNKKNIYDPFGIRYLSDYPGYEGTNMNNVKRNNQGIKLKSDKVYAYDAGTVTSVTDIGPYRAIIVSTPDGGYHVYNNIDNVNVKNGDRISKNTYLGESAYDEDSKVKGFEFRMATVQPTKLIYQNPYEAVFTDPTQYMKMYGGKIDKYPGGGETKYYTTIDESGGNTPSQPKTKDELDKVSKFLLYLLAETTADQMPGKVGEAYKHGKVGYELYNQGIIPSMVEGAKVPVPYYGDLLMNFLNNNPWYNSYDLDKKLFGSSSPRGFIDSDIKPSKKKSKS